MIFSAPPEGVASPTVCLCHMHTYLLAPHSPHLLVPSPLAVRVPFLDQKRRLEVERVGLAGHAGSRHEDAPLTVAGVVEHAGDAQLTVSFR